MAAAAGKRVRLSELGPVKSACSSTALAASADNSSSPAARAGPGPRGRQERLGSLRAARVGFFSGCREASARMCARSLALRARRKPPCFVRLPPATHQRRCLKGRDLLATAPMVRIQGEVHLSGFWRERGGKGQGVFVFKDHSFARGETLAASAYISLLPFLAAHGATAARSSWYAGCRLLERTHTHAPAACRWVATCASAPSRPASSP